MPEHAFFCSVTAAVLMGVPLPRRLEESPQLHVAVPAPHHPPEGRGVAGHRLQLAGDYVRVQEQLRLSSPEQLWCQLGSLLTVPELVAAGDFLIHWRHPLTTTGRLRKALADYPGRRGRPALREAITLLNDRAESPMESELRVILMRAGITGFVVNAPIVAAKRFPYRADLAFLEEKVVIEYQGGYHGDEVQRGLDMTRRSRLEADGWFVIEVGVRDLHDPAELTSRIRSILRTRPRPSMSVDASR